MLVPASLLLIQLPADVPGNVVDGGPSAWVSAINVEWPRWLWPDLDLAVADIWGMMEAVGRYLSSPLCLLFT